MPPKAQSLHIPEPPATKFDRTEANRLIDGAFENRGWLFTEDGETKHAVDKMKATMFNVYTTEHIVTATAVKGRRPFNELAAEAAITRLRLYIKVFPDGPGAQQHPRTPEEDAAREFLANQLWRLSTVSNRKGWLQQELAASNLAVFETKVFSADPGVPAEIGRYVTNVDQAILEFLEHKVFEDVRRKVSEADAWLATFYKRNPDVALTAAKKAKAALKSAVDSALYANPAYVKDTLALGSGEVDADA